MFKQFFSYFPQFCFFFFLKDFQYLHIACTHTKSNTVYVWVCFGFFLYFFWAEWMCGILNNKNKIYIKLNKFVIHTRTLNNNFILCFSFRFFIKTKRNFFAAVIANCIYMYGYIGVCIWEHENVCEKGGTTSIDPIWNYKHLPCVSNWPIYNRL